jgi:gamma-glutamyl-gamma-aminobutyrate hydrolase PuuD
MKPLIGINLDIKAGPPEEAAIQTNYTDAILKSGGIPVLLAPMPREDLREVLRRLDGLMLIGGADYCPSLYDEAAHPSCELTPAKRQEFDVTLVSEALSDDKMPILGICLGCQLININQGGTLVQDIKSHLPESPVEHASKNGWKVGFNQHDVIITEDGILKELFSAKQFSVPTSHHQSVRKVGKQLKVVATAEDGVIEAIEMQDRDFVVGVQWHPERDYETNRPLFEKLITASQGRRSNN